jgi:cytoskeletal protein CcmA (bactofilin family)
LKSHNHFSQLRDFRQRRCGDTISPSFSFFRRGTNKEGIVQNITDRVRNAAIADRKEDFATTLGADAVFKGELTVEKGVQLLGRFEGQITSTGEVNIAEGASLQGDVKAGNVSVEGNIEGNLNAAKKIQLAASARLEGDLETPSLEVAEGAMLVGRCVVGVKQSAKGNGKVTASKKAAAKDVTPATSKAKAESEEKEEIAAAD